MVSSQDLSTGSSGPGSGCPLVVRIDQELELLLIVRVDGRRAVVRVDRAGWWLGLIEGE